MATVKGLPGVLAGLRKITSRYKTDARIDVGFTAPYAIFIHEFSNPKTLGAGVPRPSGIGEYWGPPQFGPKYLESTLREFGGEARRIIREAVKGGKTVAQGMFYAAQMILRIAKSRVPVEHGELRDSGVAKVVRGD